MKRYNAFYQIHKALRTMLYETAISLQQTDFINTEERNEAISRLEEVVTMFESHAHSEDIFVLPALEQFDPSVTTLFAEEHIQDHALGEQITALLAKAKRQLNAEELIELGSSINKNFAAFLVFNLNHMAKEEIILNELLWRYYSDEEIQAITSKIIAHIEPRLLAIANRWMLRSLSNNEILFWLQQVKAKMPEQVFEGIIQTAYTELSESRFKYITHYLAEAKVA